MKIAVTATGGSLDALLSERFGRCPYFVLVDSDTMKFDAVSNLGEQMQGGAGPKAVQTLVNFNADVLLTGQVGDKAADALEKTSIKVVTGFTEKTKVKDAVNSFLNSEKS